MNASTSFTSKLTTPDGINYVNMVLMLISLVAAYIIPFELFLFSYAILGPLHYLTEISWLEKKSYFIKSKSDIWLLVILGSIISYGLFDTDAKTNTFVANFMFVGFVYGLIILFVEKLAIKLLLVFFTFIVSKAVSGTSLDDLSFVVLAVWLPTIFHVYFFTGAFMLFGALKSRSKSGIAAVFIFIACAAVFFIYMPENFGMAVSDYGKKVYLLFKSVNITLYNVFGFGNITNEATLYFGPKSVAIMRFIAFAYTYHYLNWFSKTTVIKWNDVSKQRIGVIIFLWLLSVALYIFDYKIGFYALFLLSMLHVFLEFPLNHHSFIGIGKELKAIMKK